MSRYDVWANRAYKLLLFVLLPIKLTENSSQESLRGIGIVLALPWFVFTLPLQLLLLFPAVFCMLMAASYSRG